MANIEYHREGIAGPMTPSVCVKDSGTYHSLSVQARADIETLGEPTANAIYDGVCEDFWRFFAPEIAERYGYGAVYSEGRSAGWLVVQNPPELDGITDSSEIVEDDPTGAAEGIWTEAAQLRERAEHWIAFAAEIDALVEACQSDYPVRLREAVEEREAEQRERVAMSERDIVTIED